jgi:hypothetical protein
MKERTRLIVRLLATMGLMVLMTAAVAIEQAKINCIGGVCEGTRATI